MTLGEVAAAGNSGGMLAVLSHRGEGAAPAEPISPLHLRMFGLLCDIDVPRGLCRADFGGYCAFMRTRSWDETVFAAYWPCRTGREDSGFLTREELVSLCGAEYGCSWAQLCAFDHPLAPACPTQVREAFPVLGGPEHFWAGPSD